MKPCDGKQNCHNNKILNEEPGGLRYICKICKQINVVRIDQSGRPDNRKYAKLFKRDIAQPGTNLYYRLHQENMNLL